MSTSIDINNLLQWYKKKQRDLPWRKDCNTYRIWVSEVILQQTQVSRGIEYYERFIERFPTLESLAAARWPSLLKVWRGLGYYNRARNMLKAAKIIWSEYGGEIPSHYDELLSLPGIGPYTARAIQSFAFGKGVPAIDTNLNRVFQRVYGCPASQVELRATELYKKKPRSGKTLNYALMDLGSTICTSRSPKCDLCPLSKKCDYKKNDKHFETKASKQKFNKKTEKNVMKVAVGCIHENGAYLIGKRKRSKGGKWEFPGGKCEGREGVRTALKREVKEELGIEVSVRPPFLVTEFSDDTYQWRIHFCRCQILAGKEKALEHEKIEWVKANDLKRYKMPSRNKEAVERLLKFK